MRYIATLTKDELVLAARQSHNMTQFIRFLGFADGDNARQKIRKLISNFNIDISHFRSHKAPASDETISERRQESHFRRSKKISENRKKPEFRANFLLEDYKRSDKKTSKL